GGLVDAAAVAAERGGGEGGGAGAAERVEDGAGGGGCGRLGAVARISVEHLLCLGERPARSGSDWLIAVQWSPAVLLALASEERRSRRGDDAPRLAHDRPPALPAFDAHATG